MRELSAVDTLVARLETMPNRPPTVYENNDLPPSPPFLIFDAIPIAPKVLSLKHSVEYSGTIQITVVTLDNEGLTQAENIARRVAAMFPVGEVIDGVRIVLPPHLEKGYPDSGLWRQPLKIRWRVLPG